VTYTSNKPVSYEVDGEGRVYAVYANGEVLPTGLIRKAFAGKSHITPEAFEKVVR
jgi:hypothetical protein